jgi:hypothetical protein
VVKSYTYNQNSYIRHRGLFGITYFTTVWEAPAKDLQTIVF